MKEARAPKDSELQARNIYTDDWDNLYILLIHKIYNEIQILISRCAISSIVLNFEKTK